MAVRQDIDQELSLFERDLSPLSFLEVRHLHSSTYGQEEAAYGVMSDPRGIIVFHDNVGYVEARDFAFDSNFVFLQDTIAGNASLLFFYLAEFENTVQHCVETDVSFTLYLRTVQMVDSSSNSSLPSI